MQAPRWKGGAGTGSNIKTLSDLKSEQEYSDRETQQARELETVAKERW